MSDNRTTEALLSRRALAEKATQEPWDTLQIYGENENYVGPEMWAAMGQSVSICRYEKDARFIAANSPDVVMADIDEILRLRAEVERLGKEAERLATWLANAYIDHSLLPEIDNGMSPPDPYQVREAARKAVEKCNANS